MISIHAPTRGATSSNFRMLLQNSFQSTHPRGVRQQTYTKAHCCLCFQYTFSTNTCQFFGSCLLFFSTLSTYLAIPRCEPNGEFLSAWTSHRPKMRVKLRYFKSRKKANQNRVCQLEKGRLARKRSPHASALCVHSKSQRRGFPIHSPPFAAALHPSYKPSYWFCSWGKT